MFFRVSLVVIAGQVEHPLNPHHPYFVGRCLLDQFHIIRLAGRSQHIPLLRHIFLFQCCRQIFWHRFAAFRFHGTHTFRFYISQSLPYLSPLHAVGRGRGWGQLIITANLDDVLATTPQFAQVVPVNHPLVVAVQHTELGEISVPVRG